MTARLRARELTLGYGDLEVVRGLDLDVPDGRFTAVIGPNACGKSTLLRSLVRLLAPRAGHVELDGRALASWPTRELARHVAFLPQDPVTPEDITVRQLVARGRYPHRSLLALSGPDDVRAAEHAMEVAGVTGFADRRVDQLSGGQRQRAWVAMVLAQETDLLLLDEPTSFLDITHQYQLLTLLADLRDRGRTVVAVLHDINQAARFADHVVAMRDGAVLAQGPPTRIVTADLLDAVFDLPCVVVPDPVSGSPMVVPSMA